jgi:hypothetical protein
VPGFGGVGDKFRIVPVHERAIFALIRSGLALTIAYKDDIIDEINLFIIRHVYCVSSL